MQSSSRKPETLQHTSAVKHGACRSTARSQCLSHNFEGFSNIQDARLNCPSGREQALGVEWTAAEGHTAGGALRCAAGLEEGSAAFTEATLALANLLCEAGQPGVASSLLLRGEGRLDPGGGGAGGGAGGGGALLLTLRRAELLLQLGQDVRRPTRPPSCAGTLLTRRTPRRAASAAADRGEARTGAVRCTQAVPSRRLRGGNK